MDTNRSSVDMNGNSGFEVFILFRFKVHSRVTFAFTIFFDLCCPILENANIKYAHHNLLVEPILMLM